MSQRPTLADKIAWIIGGFLGKVPATAPLAHIVMALTYNTLVHTPLTTNFSAWYAGHGLAMVAFNFGLAAFGFYTSQTGRPIFQSGLRESLEEWDGHSDRIGCR